jgi:putative PIN family toxin of toxin-antitoxin system
VIYCAVRLVMDTDAVVAAMPSPGGASAALLRAARAGRVTLLASAPLCLEYEAVCSRPEHLRAAGFDVGDVAVFLDAMVEPVATWFLWRPQLRDPDDELVLEAAVNGRADAIVTFNGRDFLPAAVRFGVEVLMPRDALRKLLA